MLKELLLPPKGEDDASSAKNNNNTIGSFLIQSILSTITTPELSLKIVKPLLKLIGKAGWIGAGSIHKAVIWKTLALAGRVGPCEELMPRVVNAMQGGSKNASVGVEDILMCLLVKGKAARGAELVVDMCGAKAFGSFFDVRENSWSDKMRVKLVNSNLFTASVSNNIAGTESQLNNLLNVLLINGGLARCVIDPILDLKESENPYKFHDCAVSLAKKLAAFSIRFDYNNPSDDSIGVNLISWACGPIGSKLLKKVSTVLLSSDDAEGKELALNVVDKLARGR